MTTTTWSAERHLNPATVVDAVTLRVGDLEAMTSYYSNAFALEPLAERSAVTQVQRVLGRGDVPMVRLVHSPGLPVGDRRGAGLFHTAFLFDTQQSLAATVYRAAQNEHSRFVGSSDHLVSEAFYFTDPEGNGVELYRDRPRQDWSYDHGQVRMDTLWLDPKAYLDTHLSQEGLTAGPSLAGRVGHVHLQVGDIPRARAFYVDALGFEATLSAYPGALFTSAGGYHHHIAMNTWNSAGAGPRAASLGLGTVTVTVPGRDDLDALAARLTARSIQFADDGRSITTADPWQTEVRVALPNPTVDEALHV